MLQATKTRETKMKKIRTNNTEEKDLIYVANPLDSSGLVLGDN